MPERLNAHAFLQWKGTDACFDFYCECGAHSHHDGLFAQVVACSDCGGEWSLPSVVPAARVADVTGMEFTAEGECSGYSGRYGPGTSNPC